MNLYNIYIFKYIHIYIHIYVCSISLKYLVFSLKMSLTTLLIFLDGIYRINYIPLIYHLIDLEHTTIPLTYLLLSQGLDSRSFPSKICNANVCKFWDSRFKILGKSSWIQALRSWGSGCQSGLGFKNFPQNLESWTQENLQTFVFFWDSRFKIQDNFWGFNVCVCTWVFTWLLEFYCIYIYGTPHKTTKTWPKIATKNISSKCA